MIPFEEYRDRFRHVDLVREEGILQLTMHSDGGSLVWGQHPCDELTEVFRLLADDYHNRVVIVTGAGEVFIDGSGSAGVVPSMGWGWPSETGQAATVAQLDIGIPMIAAVNGPVRARPDIAVLCDVVLAAPTAVFPAVPQPRSRPMASARDPQADCWPHGAARSRRSVPRREVSVREALRLGLVAEVVDPVRLLGRSWELAWRLRSLPPKTLRYTRQVFAEDLRARAVFSGPEHHGASPIATPPTRRLHRTDGAASDCAT